MARIPRIVAADVPHHITQRGNRRQRTFFFDEDYRLYLSLMAEWCQKHSVEVWAYCLIPNHVHLVAVPKADDGLRRAIGEAHRRYTRHINFREGWRGHLWQGRFHSFPMDISYCLSAARYVELNPVRANLVSHPEDYPWSSAHAHLTRRDDVLVSVSPLLSMVDNWAGFLRVEIEDKAVKEIRHHECTGRPLGDSSFIGRLETASGRLLRYRKPGPKTEHALN
jgi:putative transposase